MKIALCLSGQLRYYHTGIKLLKKNLGITCDTDVFIHTWSDQLNYVRPINLAFPSLQGITIEPYVKFEPPETSNLRSMFYSIYSVDLLRQRFEQENNFRYDCVIRWRSDAAILEKVELENYDLTQVNAPDSIGNPSRFCDWFNFGNSEVMSVYTSTYKNMVYLVDKYRFPWAGEEFLWYHLQHNKIKYEKVNLDVKLIREDNSNLACGWIHESDASKNLAS